MTETARPVVKALYRYPVKGLTGERLAEVMLELGKTLTLDRAWAFENGQGKFDPDAPRHLPKTNFLMLMRNERLAALDARLEDDNHTLTLELDGAVVAQGRLDSTEGRAVLEKFMAGFMDAGELRGAPHIVRANNHSFSDVAAKCVHIINLASLREVEKVMGIGLDPLRFRANIYIDGIAPWEEFGWMDTEISLGEARLRVFKRTVRCHATNVDPKTAARDETNIPMILKEHFGHSDLGIYAEVTHGGLVRTETDLT